MSAPVINAASSILGFKRNEEFSFTPAGTNVPVVWGAVGLPPGVTIDAPPELAATGVAATDVVTATGHDLQDGDRLYFSALTGGTGLVVDTIYYARDVVAATSCKLAASAGGVAIDFTSDISAGTLRRVSTGRISGACATAGVHVVTVAAANLAEEAGSRDFVLGFSSEVALGAASAGVDGLVVEITLPGGGVRIGGASSGGVDAEGRPAALATLKDGDTRLLIVRFVDGTGARVDPDPDTLVLAIKEREPEGAVLEADGFEKVGEGVTAEFNLPLTLSGAALAGVLSNYENYAGPALPTVAGCLADMEWTRAITHNGSALTLRASTQTFGLAIERDIAAG